MKIEINEDYQHGYTYSLSEPSGQHFDPDFTPDLTPAQMLQLGIFGGNYFKSIPREFPREWFKGLAFSKTGTVGILRFLVSR